jgi:DNA repair photolyase
MPVPTNEVRSVKCKTLLTPASGFLYAFTHTLNPYMGCAFGDGGCGVYCYVAESPMGLYAARPWGHWLSAKVNAADVLRRELGQLGGGIGLRVFMSSATDPYQPVERRMAISRSILEVFSEMPPELLVVQTRSPLVERDFDLLRAIPNVWLSMTIETDDDEVRRALTPACPSISRRVETMQKARRWGIKVQAAVSPTLPHDLHRFADILADASDRIIVDTFFGDGSNGRRTAHRPLPVAFREQGFGDWRDQSAAESLHGELLCRIGHVNVGWSQDGFNALASVVSRVRLGAEPPSVK